MALRVLLVLSLFASLIVSVPAAAVEPDDVLLFVGWTDTDTGSTARLMTVRADGDGATTLATTADGWIGESTWSPDGTRVAFAEYSNEASSIVVVNSTGGGRVVLSTDVSANRLVWSPDGKHVAASGFDGSDGGVWVFAADGSGGDRIVPTQHYVAGLDWSPDGSRIVFAQDVAQSDEEFPRPYSIRTVAPDGSGLESLTDGSHSDQDPKWSPDGQMVAYKRVVGRAVADLLVMSATGDDQRVISSFEDRGWSAEAIVGYEWSPDSSRIVFSAMSDAIGHPNASLFIAQAGGTQAQMLLAFDADDELAYVYPSWSPDGQTVAFVRLRPHDMHHGSASDGIFLIEADGTNVRVVHDGMDGYGEVSFAPPFEDEDDENRVRSEVPASTDGEPVTVTADMPAGTVEVTFSQVSSGGSMTVVQREATPGERAPAFSVLDTAFDISVSGVVFTSAEVCVPFDADEAEAAGLSEDDLSLYHIGADGIRRNVTTSLDTEAGVVCGRVDGFSPFLVGHARLDRLAGLDRAATAATVSAQAFEPGVAVAYVATQADYPDALAGGPAAAGAGGPILLVARDAIPAATQAELTRLQPQGITVLGGTGVVSAQVEQQLNAFTQGPVARIAGDDRYETAADISAAHFDPGVGVVYVATGLNFPDALAGGAAAAAEGGPVLLVRTNSLPQATADELDRLNPGEIVLLGGTSAVTQQVEQQLAAYTDGQVRRVFGDDRYATAAAVLARFDAPADVVYVATGDNFPDALASVPAAALTGSPLALVRSDALPAPVRTQLDRLSPDHLYVLGGHAAVAAVVEAPLAQTLR